MACHVVYSTIFDTVNVGYRTARFNFETFECDSDDNDNEKLIVKIFLECEAIQEYVTVGSVITRARHLPVVFKTNCVQFPEF